jgi:hypothetical protein
VRYLVGVAYDTPLTEPGWPGDAILRAVPHNDSVLGYAIDEVDLPQGRVAHIGVRAEDDQGRLSPLSTTLTARVPAAWWLNGRLVDPDGDPVGGISVSVGDAIEYRTVSAPDGRFSLPRADLAPGGFRDLDKFVLTVRDELEPDRVGRWYDIRTDSLGAAAGYPLALLMVPGRDEFGEPLLQPQCGPITTYRNTVPGPDYNAQEFLLYLRSVTNTSSLSQPRLMKWGAYPVRWWLRSPATNTDGVDFRPLFQAAMAAWNEALGDAYFVEAADSAGADLRISVEGLPEPFNGITKITEPFYGGINSLVPTRMQVLVARDLVVIEYAAGVILHELGHALCIGGHGECEEALQIMRAGARNIPTPNPAPPYYQTWQSNMVAAIAAEERLVARLVRLLPQYVNMHQYQLD